jgi:very-short-patch-repair endonuclease
MFVAPLARRARDELKHEFARRLRRGQTDVERKLWYALRNRRFARFKFRRQ